MFKSGSNINFSGLTRYYLADCKDQALKIDFNQQFPGFSLRFEIKLRFEIARTTVVMTGSKNGDEAPIPARNAKSG